MKIVIVLLVMVALGVTANAQDTSKLSISAGFMFAPQAAMNLKAVNKGFEASWGLFALVSFTKGKVSIAPFYTLNTNTIGIFPNYQCSKNVGVYGVVSKNILDKGNYAGVGMGFNVANGIAGGFVEIGSSLNNSSPAVSLGAFIPLTFKVK